MNRVNMIGRIVLCGTLAVAGLAAPAARQGPWTKERAWAWYDAQPWIRGCNYMPASAAASLAVEGGCAVQDVDYGKLRKRLVKEGMVLE